MLSPLCCATHRSKDVNISKDITACDVTCYPNQDQLHTVSALTEKKLMSRESCSLLFLLKIFSALLVVSVIVVTGVDIIFFQAYFSHFPALFSQVLQTIESIESIYQFDDTAVMNDATTPVSLREELSKMRYEMPNKYAFKSPYIIAPKIYSDATANKTTNSSNNLKVISCYHTSHWFYNTEWHSYNRDFKPCPYDQCVFEYEGANVTADVLLVFIGYIPKHMEPPARPPGQIWVFTFWESPAYYDYPKNYEPWKSAFNWTLNYKLDSDIFAPINRLAWRKREDLLPDRMYYEIAKNKTKTAAWFVSHCHTQAKREIYVREMQKYIDVDIYGRCGNLECPMSELNICEKMLTTTYKFYLSFENSICTEYVTEKFFRTFRYRSHIIPVVRGGFDYNKYIPNGAFVNAANFSTAKDLALYLRDLGNDHESYAKMLKEKDKLTNINYKFDWCDLCEKIHTQTGTQFIPDIKEWTHKGACTTPTDIRHP